MYSYIGAPDEAMKATYLADNNHEPLRAFIKACEDGHLGAVMALSPLIDDINRRLPDTSTCYTYI